MGLLGLQAPLRLDAVQFLRCRSRSGEYDLIAVHFKFPYIYGAFGNENPWIDEICERTDAYSILLNEIGRQGERASATATACGSNRRCKRSRRQSS